MVHKYTLFENNIAIDVNSGAIHVFDDLSFKILSSFDEKAISLPEKCPAEILAELKALGFAADDINDTYDEILSLHKNGELFTPDIEIGDFSKHKNNMVVKALCLHIAHDCNLKCDYCFASKGDFGTGKKLMPLETAIAAIDFAVKNSADRKNIEVDFFGGEPLMNFDVVKETIKYARSIEKEHGKNFRFTITTNGVLLDDDKIDFINKEMSNVVLSIDGRKSVNDDVRKTINGAGSYDVIMPKFKKLAKARNYQNYYVRGTFTAKNLDFSEDVLHLFNEGFDQISVEPVVLEQDCDMTLKEEHMETIAKEYEKLLSKILEIRKNGGKINFFHFMIDLKNTPCAIKRIKGCGSGSEYLSVTPEGHIYPCHQFVGKDEFFMGDVFDGIKNTDILEEFKSANLTDKKDCNDCFAKYFCCGGCNANNYAFNGDILKPHKLSCELQRKRLECAIAANIL